MRFVLDQNVDAAVRSVLLEAGHDAWTADQAGLGEVDDDELAIYADDHRAALMTHDHEFSVRRRRNTIGQHIYLTCHETDAAEIVKQHLDEIVRILGAVDHAVLTVSRSKLTLDIDWQ